MSDHQHQLRRALQAMFPPQRLAHYHRGPVCTLLQIRCRRGQCWPAEDSENGCPDCEVSSEPSSRASVTSLRHQLAASLRQHQAKPAGLCPIRRQIYDQLFDELIRQVTVGCVEQGLLLFAVRDELKMSLDICRRLYQSGLEFGLRKALRAELELNRLHHQTKQSETQSQKDQLEAQNKLIEAQNGAREEELEVRNKLESVDRMLDYYKQQLSERDQIIEQQRSMIRALNQEVASNIRSPI